MAKPLSLEEPRLRGVSKGEATFGAIHPSRRAFRAPQDEELPVWIASLARASLARNDGCCN
jgi:hypothetical protein